MKFYRYTIADYSGKVYWATDDLNEAKEILEEFDEDFRSRKELAIVESI